MQTRPHGPEFRALWAVARGGIGAGQIRNDPRPRLRVVCQVEAQAIRFVGVDAGLAILGKRPPRDVRALADVNPRVFRLAIGDRNTLGEKIHSAEGFERVFPQVNAELVAFPGRSRQGYRPELGHLLLRRTGRVNALWPSWAPRRTEARS